MTKPANPKISYDDDMIRMIRDGLSFTIVVLSVLFTAILCGTPIILAIAYRVSCWTTTFVGWLLPPIQ